MSGPTIPPLAEQIAVLERGAVDLEPRAELLTRLEHSHRTQKPLKIKAGFDPTAPDLHLGHTVLIEKMAQFQRLGHEVIFIVGDYTALIGDPSDKNKLRPMLTQEDIQRNEATYFHQAARILDATQTELRHNSEWLGALSFPDIISLMSKLTAAEMVRRGNFRNRWDQGDAVYLHEFL